jgi:hypothetical protein
MWTSPDGDGRILGKLKDGRVKDREAFLVCIETPDPAIKAKFQAELAEFFSSWEGELKAGYISHCSKTSWDQNCDLMAVWIEGDEA